MQTLAQKSTGVEAYDHEAERGQGHHDHHPQHGFFRTYVWSHDHKMIGIQYLFASLFFMAVSGLLAMGVRWQLAFPGQPVPLIGKLLPASIVGPDGAIQPGGYNALVTMHATVMIFLAIMPLLIGAFGNFLIPLKIGAPDMAFPFFNALSFWLFFASGVIMLSSFFVPHGAPAGGWTAYAPLSTNETYNGYKEGQSLWAIGIFINGLASIAGAANYITTIVNMRCPGMTMFRVPLAVWSLFVTSFLLLLAVPVLSAAGAMLWFDLNMGTKFFSGDNVSGGQPLLWQHLFWFFGHPEVYIMILPAFGLTSEILPVFSRKPIFGYRAMIFSMVAIAFLGFIVWGHHMFVSGMNLVLSATFSLSTMVIAVPSAIKVFNWMGTVWNGSIRFATPMLFALAFVTLFVIGGFSGIFMAATPVDLFVHHTYYIVAHIHYVLFGGSLFAILGAVYFWFPKMFGRMMSEKLGKWHFALTFVFFNLTFFPMHNLGLAGMMRRIADPTQYEHLRNLQPLQIFRDAKRVRLGAVVHLVLVELLLQPIPRRAGPRQPLARDHLEWTLPSPVRLHGNFEKTPHVYHGPYEYSVPGMKDDFLPQNVPFRDLPRTKSSH